AAAARRPHAEELQRFRRAGCQLHDPNLEIYFQTQGVEVAAMLEMDAMIGTLEFVACSDWVTVLPSLISVNGIAAEGLVLNAILAPPLHAEFVLIQPARRTLSVAARL